MRTFIILFFCLPLILGAQSLKETADIELRNSNWSAAATIYEQYLETNSTDSSAWFNLGQAQIALEAYDAALESLEKAASYNFNAQFVGYNKGRVLAHQGKRSMMLEALKKAADNGLITYAQMLRENAFDAYRGDKEFQSILSRVELNAYPCLTDEDARHFDFWLGEWEVFARGQKAGENSITRAVGGCAIHENYTTGRNYAGQSINYYDPVDKKWHQHWVGSGGDVYNFLETNKAPGMIEFQSKYLNPQGQINWMKMTFTANEDGSVRQLMENSTDEGKSWTTAFDGLYKKKME